MDLNKIEYFKAVAHAGNISKASRIVGLSQPALTLQIQALEYDLNLKLFERHNRGLILTEEGHTLLERARLLEDWRRETTDILQELSEPNGMINVGTYTTASSYLLAPNIANFFKSYPQISIKYHYPSTDQIIQKIKNLELDCAILSETPDDSNLEITPIYRSELIYVAPKEFRKNSLRPSDLANHHFLSYPVRMDYCYQQVEKKFGKYLKKAHVPIESESFDTLKNCLINGIGNSFMPRYIIQNELNQKILKEVKILNASLPVTFSFVTKKGRKLPARVEVFKQYLISELT